MIDEPTRALTQSQIDQIPKPLPTPEGFDPLKASNPDLVKYGYPPRPSKAKYPQLRALWEDVVSRRPQIVDPHFKVGEHIHVPLTKDLLDLVEDADPENASSGNWSGAVQATPPAGQTFCYVGAKWIVPALAIPQPPDADTPPHTYEEGTWVGIDGWFNGEVFQTGTVSTITVNTGGSVSGPYYYAFHEWYPAGVVLYPNLPVTAGDLVSAFVWGHAGNTKGYVYFANLTTNQTSGLVQLTAPPNTVLAGTTAEWIVEDASGQFGANYGAEVFLDCVAISSNPAGTATTTFGLTGATLVNTVQSNITVSTAAPPLNPSTLLTYAYTDGP